MNILPFLFFLIFFHRISTGKPLTTNQNGKTNLTHTLLKQKDEEVASADELLNEEKDDSYKHLLAHVKSLTRETRGTKKDSRVAIKDVYNLWACLDDDSPNNECCKIGEFK